MGQICHYFGWSVDYLLWEIDWRIIQRMFIDAPFSDDEEIKNKTGHKGKSMKLKEQNAEELLEQLKQYQ